MEKTKKSLFSKIFVCLSLCLVLLGALAPCFSMTKNEPLKADSYENASVKFIGSELWFPYIYYQFRGDFGSGIGDTVSISRSFDYSVLNGSFSYTTDGEILNVFDNTWLKTNIKLSFSVDSNNELYINYPIPNYLYEADGNLGIYFTSDKILKYSDKILISEINNTLTYYANYTSGYAISSYCFCDNLFDYTNVLKVSIYSGLDYTGKYVYINYKDLNNYSLRFAFYVANDFNFPIRTYYFENGLDLTDSDYYNQGFDAGYSDGYNKGNTDGNKQGYDTGYKAGNTIGYENGYNKGLNDSNQYTFLNLVSATIDAPFQYFQSLFNFDLLGVNLSSFLLAIFTVCVVVTIVKLCLGR